MGEGTRDAGRGAASPANGRSSLPSLVRMAAISGVEATILRFLSSGGSPNASDEEGRTLLHLAATRGHHSVCRLLLDAGASVSIPDSKGNDAFSLALASGSVATTELIRGRISAAKGSISASGTGEQPTFANQPQSMEAAEPIWSISDLTNPELPTSLLTMAESDEPGSRSYWETEEESLPPVGDDSCLESAGLIQTRINWHETIDNDSDWTEIEINLPTVRRGVLRYSGLEEDLLLRVSGLLEHGESTGSVPATWLESITETCSREDHKDDLRIRLEMLLGELGIQVVDEIRNSESDLKDGDPLDLPIEILEFLEDIGSSSAEPLDFYYRTLSVLPLLSKEEEQSFGRMWQDDHDSRGINGLVEGNLRFVVKEARKFRGFGLDLPDLISEGNLGLITAAMRFDPSRENRFLTYAAWWVRQSIFHALTEHGQSIRLPGKVSNLIRDLERQTQALNHEYGRGPTRQEIADSMSMEVKTVDRLQQLQLMLAVFPMNETLIDLGFTDEFEGFGFQLEAEGNAFDTLDQEAFLEQIEASLASLSEKERTIVSLHFGIRGEDPGTHESHGIQG